MTDIKTEPFLGANILRALHGLLTDGIGMFVAGGAIRDTMHGFEAKDIDIIVHGDGSHTEADLEVILGSAEIHAAMGKLGYYLDSVALPQEILKYLNRADDRLALVQKWCPYDPRMLPVDIIVYRPQFTDMQQIIDSFDHNICQYAGYYEENGTAVQGYMGDLATAGKAQVIRDAWGDKATAFDIAERCAHIKQVAKRLGWEYVS